MKTQSIVLPILAALISIVAACGGGSSSTNSNVPPPSGNGSTTSAMSSGSITAFGSVFVNGHEFNTSSAKLIDDDTDAETSTTAGLEVGMVVDVKAAADSTSAAPRASELHLHPLARGFVDASNTTASTLNVMGQTIQISSTTVLSDHRSCLSASVAPCTAITDQSGLTATSGTGTSAIPGTYVAVHGYLFDNGSGSVNIVATLISVADVPTVTAAWPVFKAEGVVSATATNAITIGGLNVDLSSATCRASGATTPCASAFQVGQVVSVFAKTQPSLPVTNLVADFARLRSKLVIETAAANVELEGSVSSVTTSPAGLVIRGITIDASGLAAGTSLPAVGDIVRIVGTVSGSGQSVVATSIKILHVAKSATIVLVGDASNITPGGTSNTFTFSVLGESISVDSSTRLSDHSTRIWDHGDPAAHPFNIASFQTYLAASISQHVIVKAAADASGNLRAISVTLVPASSIAAIAGNVDTTPAPVNSSTTGTPSTFAIHGVLVSADPASIQHSHEGGHGNGNTVSIVAGDAVKVLGTYASGALTVTATISRSNEVIDFGTPHDDDSEGF